VLHELRGPPGAAASQRALKLRRRPQEPFQWQDAVVVELGCGLGFVSMAAAHLGAQVGGPQGSAEDLRRAGWAAGSGARR
jgi:tRNA/tmRNA/rRNA uracil-C5-methylase (TrmA/RlmC/RlmD family)